MVKEEANGSLRVKLIWSGLFVAANVAYNYSTTKWVFPDFRYPGATLLAQLALSILFHIPVSYLGRYTKNEFLQKNVPVIQFSFYTWVKVLPGTSLFIGANLMIFKLLHVVGMELVNVVKALTLLITAVMQQVLLGRGNTWVSWLGVAVTSSSFFLVFHLVEPINIVNSVVSSVFSSARTVVSARQMKHVDGQGGVMSFYNAVTGLLLIPFYVWIVEYDPSDGHNPLEDIITGNTPILLPASAVIGFITNVVAFGFMGVVTPATYNLVSEIKLFTTALLGIYTNPLSQRLDVVGPNLIKFVGGVLYVAGKAIPGTKAILGTKDKEGEFFLTPTDSEHYV